MKKKKIHLQCKDRGWKKSCNKHCIRRLSEAIQLQRSSFQSCKDSPEQDQNFHKTMELMRATGKNHKKTSSCPPA